MIVRVGSDLVGSGGEIIARFDEEGLAIEVEEWLAFREDLVDGEVEERTDRDLAEKSHRYRLLDGTIGVGVTTVCGFPDEGKSDAFAYVARRLALEGLDHRVEWGYRADLGNRIHQHADDFLHGRAIDVRPDEEGYVDGVYKAIVELDLASGRTRSEAIILGPRFGGRTDVLSDWILDWKTGKERPLSQTLQLNAYNFADGIAVYDDGGTLVGVEPFEPRKRAACIFVPGDGTYVRREYPLGEEWYDHFLRLLDAQLHHRALGKRLAKGKKR